MDTERRDAPRWRRLLVAALVLTTLAALREAAFQRNRARFGPAERRRG